jgi:hypothetical protein
MDTKPGDTITIESEDGILHEMIVKTIDQNNRTVTGEVAFWKTKDSRMVQTINRTFQTITVPDHMIREAR